MKKNLWISDLIGEEYKKWGQGDAIMISTQTGTGKSYFIKNILIPYAQKMNKKVLYLYNRRALGTQTYNDIPRLNNVTIMSYQKLTEKLIDERYNISNTKYHKYEYIIYDECHYMVQDASFNNKVTFFYSQFFSIKNDYATNIFISATIEPMAKFIKKIYNCKVKEYVNEIDYSYINAYYFKDMDDLIQTINNDVSGNKWLLFINNINHGYNLKSKIKDSKFVCSVYNQKYKNKIDKQELDNVTNNERFDCKCLITTKSLDNGINLNDDKLTNIVITALNKTDFIQMLGRKRIDISNPQKVNLYIMQRNYGTFANIKNNYIDKVDKIVYEFNYNKNKFNRKYDVDIGEIGKYYNIFYKNKDNKWSILILGLIEFLSYKRFILKMYKKINYDNNIFIKEQLSWINVKYYKKNHIQNISSSSNISNLEEHLKKLYKNDIKMFKPEQEELKRFIIKDFNNIIKKVKGRNDIRLNITSLNQLLKICKITYLIVAKKENSKKSENFGKRYWVVGADE